MKRLKVKCPYCGAVAVYRNWFTWVAHTPFHWFGKRKTKCPNCGLSAYVKGERTY